MTANCHVGSYLLSDLRPGTACTDPSKCYINAATATMAIYDFRDREPKVSRDQGRQSGQLLVPAIVHPSHLAMCMHQAFSVPQLELGDRLLAI